MNCGAQNTTIYKNIKSFCGCSGDANLLIKQMQIYLKALADFKIAREDYLHWLSLHKQWENGSGLFMYISDYKRLLENEKLLTDKCYPESEITTKGDFICKSTFGNGWRCIGKVASQCASGYAQLLCVREKVQVDKELRTYASTTEPVTGSDDLNITWKGSAEPTSPVLPDQNSFVCCNRIYNELALTKEAIYDVATLEKCRERIENHLTAVLKYTPRTQSLDMKRAINEGYNKIKKPKGFNLWEMIKKNLFLIIVIAVVVYLFNKK